MDYGLPLHAPPGNPTVIEIAATAYTCPPESFASRAAWPRRLLVSVQLARKAGEPPKAACFYSSAGRPTPLKIGDQCSLSHVTRHTDAFAEGVAIDVCDVAQVFAPSCVITCESD